MKKISVILLIVFSAIASQVCSQIRVTLEVIANGNGSISLSPLPDSAGTYALGDTVLLSGDPSSTFFDFIRWTGDITSTQNPVQVIMNSNKRIVGRFRRGNFLFITEQTERGANLFKSIAGLVRKRELVFNRLTRERIQVGENEFKFIEFKPISPADSLAMNNEIVRRLNRIITISDSLKTVVRR